MIELERPLAFTWDDGGREEEGYRGKTGDCAVRACAIATGTPYKEVYQTFKKANPLNLKISHYAHGVPHGRISAFLFEFGFVWIECRLGIGLPLVRHLDRSLPEGTLVANIEKHVCAVIDHTIHDTFDAARGGVYKPPVLGFWIK